MSHKLMFVHGTGVRADSYTEGLKILRLHLAKWAPDLAAKVEVVECRWGESLGATLKFDGASVPTYGETRGVAVSEADQARALWSMLIQDPGFELALLSSAQPGNDRPPPNAARVAVELLRAFSGLKKDKPLRERIASSGLEGHWPQAVTDVEKSEGFAAAKDSPSAGLPPHRKALARAVVARLEGAALESGEPTLDEQTRKELVEAVAGQLGDDTRGVVSVLAAPFVGVAKHLATWQVRRKRTAITDSSYTFAGDILVYQARGDRIRAFIRDEIGKHANDDVFVFAHSLGGIACVEMLVEDAPKNVKGLITFGSQAPFFYEIGALSKIPIEDAALPRKLPGYFPPWNNFYDLNDPLSYVGEGIFGTRVSDYKVVSGAPFPASHSAYLRSRELWIQVEAFVRQFVRHA